MAYKRIILEQSDEEYRSENHTIDHEDDDVSVVDEFARGFTTGIQYAGKVLPIILILALSIFLLIILC